ncbi:MAG: MarR family winged helix-turn-helix transcriptional regulator [Peptococcaceae bacterium]
MKLKAEDSLGHILNRTNTKMKNKLLHSFKPYDITPEQWGVLIRLWKTEGISPKDLAILTSKDRPTVARILEKLEKKGFITREINSEDQRSHLIYLTDKGKKMENILVPIAVKTLDDALIGLEKEQIQALFQTLNTIYKNLE